MKSNLGFRFLPKDTLVCELEEPGIELPTLQLGDNLLNHLSFTPQSTISVYQVDKSQYK